MSLGFGSLGSDTGGSIRIPAALCGVVGMKPTFGRGSVRGVIPLSPSLDHIGPIARTVEDAAALLQVIAGHDPEDPLSRFDPVPRYSQALSGDITSVRVGVPRSYFFERLMPDVESAVRAAIRRLEELGAQIVDVDLPGAIRQDEIFRVIAGSEALTYHEPLLREQGALYGPDVRERLESGRGISLAARAEAEEAREALRQECDAVFRVVDVIVTPTVPIPASFLRESVVRWADGPEAVGSALTRYTRPFNLTGAPAISVPCGFTSDGLPVGLQVVGKALDESMVLRVAHAYEQVSPWVSRRPSGWRERVSVERLTTKSVEGERISY
jgi:aspartyl-tRNA(Asn)/glutamyl-tRNA(Gln) amidotransferase subunit A